MEVPVREDFDESPTFHCWRERSSLRLNPAKARVEEEGGRPFDPAPIASTESWKTRRYLFRPRTEPTNSFGGPLAEKKSNLCYTLGMANDEESVETAIRASSSVVITSSDSVNSNLVTLIVDSGASGHYFYTQSSVCL